MRVKLTENPDCETHFSRTASNVDKTLESLCLLVTHRHMTRMHSPFRGPRVAPSGAVVEQVVSPMGWATQSGDCPPQPGTCLQRQEVEPFHLIPQQSKAPREKYFNVTPVMNLILFPKHVYRGTQTVSSRLLSIQ